MRILLDPQQQRLVASRFADAAIELRAISLRLGSVPQPELPPWFGDVSGTIAAVSQQLQRQSEQLVDEVLPLRQRAALAELATAMAYALGSPELKSLGGKSLLDRIAGEAELKGALATVDISDGTVTMVAAVQKMQRLAQLDQSRAMWNAMVSPSLLRNGENSPKTLRAYFAWQEAASHAMPIDVATDAVNVARGSAAEAHLLDDAVHIGKVGRFVEVGGTVVAPVDIAFGAYTAFHGSEYHGVRGDIDRGVGGASVVGGALVLAGAVEFVPVAGQFVGGAILVGVGLWSAVNLIADHKKALARAAVSVDGFVSRHPVAAIVLAPEAAPLIVGQQIYDHASGIASGAEHVGGKVADAVSKAMPWHW